ncbi:uncharacterized protein LOC143040184 [Oratosquilla oratoria]|uniref:uncharacterized protein LOC143040184 n=1 Tax=Oratosquilla oratoria TaxID=337810 RepID=UPI003F7711C6
MESVHPECANFIKDWGTFIKVTKMLIRAFRHINHGIVEEQSRRKGLAMRKKRVNLNKHEAAFKKVTQGLIEYSLNLEFMESQFASVMKLRDRGVGVGLQRAEQRRQEVLTQRDTVLYSVECLIKAQLKIMANNFQQNSTVLEGEPIFKVIHVYNKVLDRLKRKQTIDDFSDAIESENANKNRHPYSFVPDSITPPLVALKPMTASRILQIMARERAQHVSTSISETLMSGLRIPEKGVPLPWVPLNFNDNHVFGPGSILEIHNSTNSQEEDENILNQRKLELALRMEFGEDFPGTEVLNLTGNDVSNPLSTTRIDAVVRTNANLLSLLLPHFTTTFGVFVKGMIKLSKAGEARLTRSARSRVETYYVERVWGEGAEYVEELVLWAIPSLRPPPFPPPAIMPPTQLYQLLDVFRLYCSRGLVPEACVASCECVMEECRQIALSTYMDLGLVRGFGHLARPVPGVHPLQDGNYCTRAGDGLVDVVQMLVWEINEIEHTEVEMEGKDWPIGPEVGLMQNLCVVLGGILAWIRLRASHLLHTWNTAPFYLLTQADLPKVIEELKKLQIRERDHLIRTDDMARKQFVVSREYYVELVERFVSAVKKYEEETVAAVSAVCRTVSLAQLQNSMPKPRVWKGIGRLPHEPHRYVFEYIAAVLEPTLDAVSKLGVVLQKRAGATVLKVVCYAWLEHIRVQKIKFSLWGAQQLLKDFHALAEWLRNYPGLAPEARSQILAVDVLRECEGVARLLMRQPPLVVGYASHNQIAPTAPISAGRKHDKEVRLSEEDDSIPAEMYVPHQQLWLSLRARSSSSICVRMSTCCSWPY